MSGVAGDGVEGPDQSEAFPLERSIEGLVPSPSVDQLERVSIGLVILLFVVFGSFQAAVHGSVLRDWDLMFLTGLVTLIVGLLLVRGYARPVDVLIGRLDDRGLLTYASGDRGDLCQAIAERRRRTAHRTGILLAATVSTIFLVSLGLGYADIIRIDAHVLGSSWAFLGFEIVRVVTILTMGVVGGYLAGRRVGQFVQNGRLARNLEDHGVELDLCPGHPDGAAGFEPVGEFYTSQALLLAIPAPWLATWWYLLSSPRYSDWMTGYSAWEPTFSVLLLVVFVAELLSFVLPLWAFHHRLRENKHDLLREADRLTEEIQAIAGDLEGNLPVADRETKEARLSHLEETIQQIEDMPTWPISPSTKRRFSLQNSPYLVPVVALLNDTGNLPSPLADLVSLLPP